MKTIRLALVALTLSAGTALGAADIVIYHAKVFVPDSPAHFADAVAIENGRIVRVGTDGDVAGLVGPRTVRVDARNHLVIPGFNDAHVHFNGFPPGFALPCDENSTLDQVQLALTSSVEELGGPAWMYGTIGPGVLSSPAATRQFLDAAAPGRKIMLKEFTGHGLILSSAADRKSVV